MYDIHTVNELLLQPAIELCTINQQLLQLVNNYFAQWNKNV